jgi:hypothetical protein
MEKVIAMCGLICNDCPTYIATMKEDNEELRKIAEKWNSKDFPLKPEEVICDGCVVVDKRLMKWCNSCKVRECGLERNVENCAYCEDYPCEKLNNLWKMLESGEAKKNLDMINKDLQR